MAVIGLEMGRNWEVLEPEPNSHFWFSFLPSNRHRQPAMSVLGIQLGFNLVQFSSVQFHCQGRYLAAIPTAGPYSSGYGSATN